MALRRTKEDVVTTMVEYIADNSTHNVAPGESIRDVVVSAPANEFEKTYVLQERQEYMLTADGLRTMLGSATFQEDLRQALGKDADGNERTIAYVQTLLSEDVDRFASNYGLTRLEGNYATGKVRLYTSASTTITVPSGSRVRTRGSDYKEFDILGSLTNYPVTLYDSTEGLYYVEVPIKAVNIGTAYNLSVGLITLVSPAISGVVSCKNPETTSGGTNEEADLTLITRSETAWSGRNLDTVDGYKTYCEAKSYVTEAKVADPIDDLMTRETAGAVDIWVRVGSTTITREQLITGDGSTTDFLLSYQPVHSYISSTGVSAPYSVMLIEDVTSGYAYSTMAQSKVRFASAPAYGEEITLSYRQYESIFLLQSDLDSDDNRVAAGDVLVKKAIPATLNFRMDLSVVSGYSDVSVKEDIEEALTAYVEGGTVTQGTFSRLAMGTEVEASDLYEVVVGVDGVNSVTLTTFMIQQDSESWVSTSIDIDANYYWTMGTITWLTS